jgi:hypothetical protein
MLNRDYQPPRIRNIVIACVIFLVLLGMIWTLRSSIKQLGDIFLYLPSQLGLVERVAPEEIRIIDLNIGSPTSLEITRPGRYIVFTDDYYLLLDNARSRGYDGVQLEVTARTTGEPVNVVPVVRGVRPYDTPLAEGRPIFAFEVTTPDNYEITLPALYNTSVAIVPDYTTGKEPIIVLAFIVQLVFLLSPLSIFYYQRYQRYQARIQTIRAPQMQRQTKGQAFWEAEIQGSQKNTQEKQ